MRNIADLKPSRLLATILMSAIAAMSMAGCYIPAGGIVPWSGGPATYYSTAMMPMNITLIDVRNQQHCRCYHHCSKVTH